MARKPEPPKEGEILIDSPSGREMKREIRFLEGLGHDVMVCEGPGGGRCPILAGEDCALLDAAHGVVFDLDLDREEHRAILRRYGEVVPEDVPIRVVVVPGQEVTYADLLRPFQVWAYKPGVAELDGFAASVEASDHTRTE